MAREHMLSLFAFTILVKHVLGEFVNLGNSYNFTLTEVNCHPGDDIKMTTHLNGSTQTVAYLSDGVWMAGEAYKGRIEHYSTISFGLTHLNYMDGRHYEFLCNGTVTIQNRTEIYLDVVIPFNMSVTEGETVILPCYCYTEGDYVTSMRWEKDGELVMEWDRPSKTITYGTGFEGRVSVSSDWTLHGDLSLTLERVTPEDQSEYVCYTTDKEEYKDRGIPQALRMSVIKRNPHPPQETVVGPGTILCIIAAVILIVLSFAGGYYVRSCRSRSVSGGMLL